MNKYDDLVKDILEDVGGTSNIKSVRHCQTRLRFNLVDNSKANTESLKENPGVLSVIEGDMYQIIIGTHVADVYQAFVKNAGITDGETNGETASSETKSTASRGEKVIDFISAVFTPLIPALAGSGMNKALLSLLVALGMISTDNQSYQVLMFISDATFAFLPVLVAFTAAKKMGTNQILAAVIAAALCHPTWNGMVDAGETITVLGFVPLHLVKYGSSIFPALFAVFTQTYLERFLNKYVPKSINIVVVPMILFIVVGLLTFAVLGPIGDIIGQFIVGIFLWLSERVAWLELGILGATWPLITSFGMQHAIGPIGFTQLSQVGYDSIFGPAALCSNIAMGIAVITVGFLSKSSKDKQLGYSAGVTSLMGISEPALYGMLIPKVYPLIAACIGGGVGGVVSGLLHTRRFATGSSGLPAVFMYLGDNTTQYFISIIIALIATTIVTALVTAILYKRYERKAS